MLGSAKARAQAADVLDEVARSLKRHHRETRDLIQTVRRAQMDALGIDTTHGPEGRSDDTSEEPQ